MSKFYIAYGSNLNTEQMAIRCPDAEPIGTAIMNGWRILFRGSKTGAYLTIEPWPGGAVPVVVWKVSQRDQLALDRYEGYPSFYRKWNKTLEVETTEGTRKLTAFVYQMVPNRPVGVPSQSYMRTCLAGYRHFGFDTQLLVQAVRDSVQEAAKDEN